MYKNSLPSSCFLKPPNMFRQNINVLAKRQIFCCCQRYFYVMSSGNLVACRASMPNQRGDQVSIFENR